MKDMRKKLLSLALSVVMMLSVLPMGVFADGVDRTTINKAIIKGVQEANKTIEEVGKYDVDAFLSSKVVGNGVLITATTCHVGYGYPLVGTDRSGVLWDIFPSLIEALSSYEDSITIKWIYSENIVSGVDSTSISAFIPEAYKGISTIGELVKKQKTEGLSGRFEVYSKETNTLVGQYIVSFLGHDLEFKPSKAPTCTESGIKEYYVCKNCGRMFESENADVEITEDEIVIGKTPHQWGDPVEKNGKWVKICSVCKTEEPTEAPSASAPAPTTPAATTAQTATLGASTDSAVATGKVPKNIALKVGQSTNKIQVPLGSGDKIVSVKSSDKKIATVKVLKNGRLKVNAKKKTGTVKIKVKLASGKTVKFKVRVKSKVFTTKVTVPKKLRFHAGEKYTLNVKLTPITTSQGVSYRSSNPKVAKVSKKGVVTALKKGTATITVTSGSKKAVCKVKVG